MSEPAKDTIYIDIDDEITAIVDKVQASSSKIVALVLPKRAAVLQSIVNMKLLKSASDDANKQTVLITSETGLMPLAGATGLYVAKNLQSKPEIPEGPDLPVADDEEVFENMDDEPQRDSADKLAGAAAVGAASGLLNDDDALADAKAEPKTEASKAPVAETPKTAKKAKSKKPKGSKVPNFEKFRKKIFIVGGIVALLIIFWVLAVFVLPKASLAITTNTETKKSNFDFTASVASNSVDVDGNTIPAEFVSSEKKDSQKVGATGKKDVGKKAKGSVTIRNCSGDDISIRAGIGVSSNNQTFITQNGLELEDGSFDASGNCKSSGDHVGTVKVVAQKNGDQYNLASGSSYSVAGFSSDVSGTGSAMTGGSSKTIKVVSQQDIDADTAKLDTKEDDVKADLTGKLQSKKLLAIEESFTKKDEITSASAKAGQEADEVMVSYSVKYYMAGVSKENLNKLIEASLKDEIDTDKQQIQDDGVDNATFKVVGGDIAGDSIVVSIATDVEVGPEIDVDKLKEDIAGKKSGETENLVRAFPGVQNVEVKYSPFWVNKTPSSPDKIKIEFKSTEE